VLAAPTGRRGRVEVCVRKHDRVPRAQYPTTLDLGFALHESSRNEEEEILDPYIPISSVPTLLLIRKEGRKNIPESSLADTSESSIPHSLTNSSTLSLSASSRLLRSSSALFLLPIPNALTPNPSLLPLRTIPSPPDEEDPSPMEVEERFSPEFAVDAA
jgi:hypothetical protein